MRSFDVGPQTRLVRFGSIDVPNDLSVFSFDASRADASNDTLISPKLVSPYAPRIA